jgi:hypothetical protein
MYPYTPTSPPAATVCRSTPPAATVSWAPTLAAVVCSRPSQERSSHGVSTTDAEYGTPNLSKYVRPTSQCPTYHPSQYPTWPNVHSQPTTGPNVLSLPTNLPDSQYSHTQQNMSCPPTPNLPASQYTLTHVPQLSTLPPIECFEQRQSDHSLSLVQGKVSLLPDPGYGTENILGEVLLVFQRVCALV